jgi:putative ABC transport system ATP-binding protein
MEPLIVCENLVKIYKLNGIEVVALQGLDLTVQPGELLGVIGASGSGKSTLMNVLGGLDRPSAGRVLVGGQDLLQMSDTQLNIYRRQKVGFIWQQTTRNLIPYLSALENVELPQQLSGMGSKERRRHAIELLDLMGLGNRLYHRPVMLSGGEQQRVAIAVALANKPNLLLADEPTGEVDTATAQEVYTALKLMNERYGITTLIVSHDPNISHNTGRVVAIRDGKTSTETVRVSEKNGNSDVDKTAGEVGTGVEAVLSAALTEQKKTVEFEELVVLDSAGRLQIPREYLETLNIGDRVRLELRDGQITIYAVEGRGRAAANSESQPEFETMYFEEDLAPEPPARSLAGKMRKVIQGRLAARKKQSETAEERQ